MTARRNRSNTLRQITTFTTPVSSSSVTKTTPCAVPGRWRKVFERFRRAVIAGRLLRVTGRVERQNGVVHVVADLIEDLSPLLDRLSDPDCALSQGAETG
jgi:uncharacterized membrane protein